MQDCRHWGWLRGSLLSRGKKNWLWKHQHFKIYLPFGNAWACKQPLCFSEALCSPQLSVLPSPEQTQAAGLLCGALESLGSPFLFKAQWRVLCRDSFSVHPEALQLSLKCPIIFFLFPHVLWTQATILSFCACVMLPFLPQMIYSALSLESNGFFKSQFTEVVFYLHILSLLQLKNYY